MLEKINQFFDRILENQIELYSECGLQYELAIFLRNSFPELNVRLEYPTSRIFNPLPNMLKKVIDIYITEGNRRYVIELKMPQDNGGIPKAMYHSIEDVKFLEQLKNAGINECYSIFMTSCVAFWQAQRANAGIYNYFNGNTVNIASIGIEDLPNFLHVRGPIELENVYETDWLEYNDLNNLQWKYYLLEV